MSFFFGYEPQRKTKMSVSFRVGRKVLNAGQINSTCRGFSRLVFKFLELPGKSCGNGISPGRWSDVKLKGHQDTSTNAFEFSSFSSCYFRWISSGIISFPSWVFFFFLLGTFVCLFICWFKGRQLNLLRSI